MSQKTMKQMKHKKGGKKKRRKKKSSKQYRKELGMSTPQGHTILLSQFFKLSHNTVSDTRGTFITRHQLSARANAVDKNTR
jgi:hypothetical protein